jgi:micrococcal nuclease
MEAVVEIMYEYKIKEIVKVVDGDTVDVLIDLGFHVYHKERVRLSGIDTPEMNSNNVLEKEMAKKAKTFITTWLKEQKNLTIKTYKDDKYGRLLGEIFGNGGVCVNNLLMEKGLAWDYLTNTKDVNLLLELQQPK